MSENESTEVLVEQSVEHAMRRPIRRSLTWLTQSTSEK